MKNFTHSYAVKVTAYILSVLIFIITVLMVASVAGSLYAADAYGSQHNLENTLSSRYLQNNAWSVYRAYTDNVNGYSDIAIEEFVKDRNYYCTITDDGKIVFDNNAGEKNSISFSLTQTYPYNNELESTVEKDITVELFSKNHFTQTDYYSVAMRIIDFSFDNQTLFTVMIIINALLLTVIIVVLCTGAGHRAGEDGIVLSFIDRIPLDIMLLTALVVFIFEYVVVSNFYSTIFVIIWMSVCLIADYVIVLFTLTSLCTRIKSRTVITNSVIYKILSWILKGVKMLFYKIRIIAENAPSLIKVGIISFALLIFNVIIAYQCFYHENLKAVFIAESVILIPVALYFFAHLNRIEKGIRKISNGDLEYHLDSRYVPYALKGLVENVNSIGRGMSKAVDEKMRSERFKTELITNVSHDIKTPLTSIINYVDLIKKEGSENEKIAEYISVLDRQSGRLKKLIEDLVEASKVSTGNITVNYEKCDLGVLLTQTVGEYEEKLAECGLEMVFDNCGEPVNILADGRHLWRIFDNLMSNICKYSQTGTRVYLSLVKYGNKAVMTFRNISKSRLNISGDELMERFVRGDSSRNTEGSGLGLSIAKNLVELQNGKMVLTVDGDLFKVLLTFDSI